MIKTIRLTCSKITYTGDSIGDDIRVEIEILGKFFSFDKKIKVGQTVQIEKEIGRFETDQDIFKGDILIKVVEKDVVFSDTGTISDTIIVRPTNTSPQELKFEVVVQETRALLRKTKAIFTIILKTEAVDTLRYIAEQDDGWLKVRLESDKRIVSLPAYTKVIFDHTERQRDYFKILEGHFKNEKASVKYADDGSSHLIVDVRFTSNVQARYSISQKIFTLNNTAYQATDHPDTPWRKGFYDIEMPDAPHRGGQYYPEAQKAVVWFRIGHDGERYLHPGQRSLGCLTIIDVTRWGELYAVLIRARKGDELSVGTLEVVD